MEEQTMLNPGTLIRIAEFTHGLKYAISSKILCVECGAIQKVEGYVCQNCGSNQLVVSVLRKPVKIKTVSL